MSQLRILQIGGGSMGTRRLRAFTRDKDIVVSLLDLREDRRQRASSQFGVECFPELQKALDWKPDAFSISVPPDRHDEYIRLALELGVHHFVEAGIRVPEIDNISGQLERKGIVGAPSCTFYFMPIFLKLAEIVPEKVGRLHCYQMFLSCNLSDWHPYERGQFYAYQSATNAAREMVPFELIWLNRLFGFPTKAVGSIARRGELETDAMDCYLAQMQLGNGALGQLSVIMAPPFRFRRGVCAGNNGILSFDVLTGAIEIAAPDSTVASRIETGRSGDVMEKVYDDEIGAFLDSLRKGVPWPHSYEEAARVRAALSAMERSELSRSWEKVDPAIQPTF